MRKYLTFPASARQLIVGQFYFFEETAMHSVCINKAFGFLIPSMKGGNAKAPFTPLRTNPAEVRLEMQVLASGLMLSGFLLLAIHVLG